MEKRNPSDLEQRLSREVAARVEGKERTTELQYAHKLVDDLMRPQLVMQARNKNAMLEQAYGLHEFLLFHSSFFRAHFGSL